MKCKWVGCNLNTKGVNIYCEKHLWIWFLLNLKSEINSEEVLISKKWRIQVCGFNDFKSLFCMFNKYLETNIKKYEGLNENDKREIQYNRIR